MDDLLLHDDELPERLRNWLNAFPQTAWAIALERLPDGRVLLRGLPDVDPVMLARIKVTMAKYHEALMNLT